MKNTFGNSLCVTIFGESHGEQIGAVLDGLASGIDIDKEYIKNELKKRRPNGQISTSRVEQDDFQIVSGVYNGKTTGTPLTVLIKNNDCKSENYSSIENLLRPGHADYSAELKYHGYQDKRGGGHFSGRITAPLVAIGSIVKKSLEEKGIFIGSHIKSLHGITDRNFEDFLGDIALLNQKEFPTLSSQATEQMKEEIISAKIKQDSVGGVLETVICGIEGGVGEPFFDSIESVISHVMFSIPAVKGIEFGLGFGFSEFYGSQVKDEFVLDNGKITTKTNNNGGINGGITNGKEIIFRLAIKPTPSIAQKQDTVDIVKEENTEIKIGGRHDPAIIHRVRAVVDNLVAIVVADMLCQKYGTDYLAKK